MHKLNGESLDIVDENINKLKELFPEIVNEDNQVDLDALQDLFEKNDDYIVDDNEEHYKFTWWGKKNAKKIAKEKTTKTLKPSKKDSKNWDDTNNIYIEGDNLDAIKILLGSYRNRVKMIYIDPPYNTGKDFIYKDNFHESQKEYVKNTNQLDDGGFLFENAKTDGKFHSNWLNMMYSRLYLSRKLLKDEGVIFISIDDHELNNIKKICDEIFGENNFLALITVIVKTEGRRYGFFAKTHEFLLVYSKNENLINLNEIEIEGKSFSYHDDLGGYNLKELRNGNIKAFNSLNRPNLRYPFYVDLSTRDSDGFCKVSMDYRSDFKEVWPLEKDGIKSVWRWGKEKSINELDNLIARIGNDNIVRIFQKNRKLTQIPKTFWKDKSFISNKGTNEIKSLFNDKIFDFPKPLNLINQMIQIGTSENDVILDFFSGSATTAQSVLFNNAKDDGKRKFIMVQIPELTDEKSDAYKYGYKNICEIGKERIRRAGDKILEESDNKDLDIGFKVFKVDESNFIPWNSNLNEDNIKQSILSTKNNLVEGRSELDLIYELILKLNLDLNSSIEEVRLNNANENKIYVIEHGFMFVCLDNNIDMSLALDLLNLKKELKSDYSQVILMDNALNDELSININETLSSNNVKFYTI